MSTNSQIEWTENTWNPVTGCQRISSGCQNCYAEKFARRLAAMGQEKYQGVVQLNGDGEPRWTGLIRTFNETLKEPLRWKKPRRVFVNSMSDLFHDDVPVDFIADIVRVIKETPQHTYQILTKRPERLAKVSEKIEWPENVWMGVSVENADYYQRIDLLRQVNVGVRFLSLEPILGPMTDINLDGIDWVIVGGESGPGSRSITIDWVREIRDKCFASNVLFFFKQWGGVNKKKAGRKLDSREHNEMPEMMQLEKKVA